MWGHAAHATWPYFDPHWISIWLGPPFIAQNQQKFQWESKKNQKEASHQGSQHYVQVGRGQCWQMILCLHILYCLVMIGRLGLQHFECQQMGHVMCFKVPELLQRMLLMSPGVRLQWTLAMAGAERSASCSFSGLRLKGAERVQKAIICFMWMYPICIQRIICFWEQSLRVCYIAHFRGFIKSTFYRLFLAVSVSVRYQNQLLQPFEFLFNSLCYPPEMLGAQSGFQCHSNCQSIHFWIQHDIWNSISDTGCIGSSAVASQFLIPYLSQAWHWHWQFLLSTIFPQWFPLAQPRFQGQDEKACCIPWGTRLRVKQMVLGGGQVRHKNMTQVRSDFFPSFI